MVLLVWVDEHTGGSACAGTLRTDGVEDLVRTVVESSAAEAAPATPPWGTYLGVDPDTNQVVGTCGFRDAPRNGRVEIAFWTFPPFEGLGWATAMARELVALAHERPEVRVVIAHTLPERDSASSVLRANGLRYVGAVRRDAPGGDGAVRGRVWRWELVRRSGG